MATKPRFKVVVSRKWASPEIEAFVLYETVGASMDLYAFLNSVALEIDNPYRILTKEQLRLRLLAAAENIICEMKETTKHVV